MSIQSLLEQMRTRQSDQTGPDTPAPLPSFTPSGLTIGPMGGTTPASYVSNISGQVDGLKNALMSSAKNLGSIASGLSNPGGLGGMAITSNAIRPDSDFSLSELAPIASAAAPEFAEGGAVNNVYKRPMFMQQGGVAPSPMPAAQAVSGDMAAQLQATEQMASQEMEAAGAQYVDNMVSGLDNAEDTEEVINAIRGNEKPIQDRYQELAGIVGLQDAQSTPESVLALVQPTMMMTEEGAMDTGIGELVQNLTGDIAMETDTGEPTAMGQGIGELMMGASEPVQQYANGGIVQKFAQAGPVNKPIPNNLQSLMQGFTPMTDYSPAQLQTEYETRLPLYEQLLGDTANRQKQAQSKLSFDIAKAGLALASGVDPTTGQTMTGQPLGAQIARAATPVAQSAQEAGQMVAEAGRGAKVAALQAAEQAQQARLEQVGRERLGQQQLGGQAFLQEGQQAFQSREMGFDRTLQRDLAESSTLR